MKTASSTSSDEHAHPGRASGHGNGYGRGLVKSQILLAAGERLENVLHGPVLHRGHAIECRINAEHPESSPLGREDYHFNPPGGTGVRIDTAAYAEGVIPPYYDSLIAKLIVRARTARKRFRG